MPGSIGKSMEVTGCIPHNDAGGRRHVETANEPVVSGPAFGECLGCIKWSPIAALPLFEASDFWTLD